VLCGCALSFTARNHADMERGAGKRKRGRDAAGAESAARGRAEAAREPKPSRAGKAAVLPGAAYWRRLAPDLHVGDADFISVRAATRPARPGTGTHEA
jgi:hypothetical protein